MKLDHIAIWAVDIELMRTFYEKYFDARSTPKYQNERKRFTSYFLTFPGGGRLELMHRPDIQRIPGSQSSREFIGYAHLGVELGSRAAVDAILATMPLTAPLAMWIVFSASSGDQRQTADFVRSMVIGSVASFVFVLACWLGLRQEWGLLVTLALASTVWFLIALIPRWIG